MGVRLWVVCFAGVLGCGGGGDAGVDAAPAVADAGVGTITGTASLTFHGDGKPETIPLDLSGAAIAATYFDSAGDAHTLDGTGTSAGKFTIEQVPEVVVAVGDGFAWLITAARELDFGADYEGRYDWAFPSDGTTFRMTVDNMTAWSDNDELAFYSTNLGMYDTFLLFSAAERPTEGATALTDLVLDWFWPLVDGSAGDQAVFVHHIVTNQPGSNERVWVASEMFVPEAFDQVDGGETVLTGSFEPIADQVEVDLRWTFSTFTAMRERIHPEATPSFFTNVEIYAEAGGVSPDTFTFGPMLMSGFLFDLTPSIDFGTVQFGNPFPNLPLFVTAFTNHAVELSDPTGDLATTAFGELLYATDLATYGDGPIELQVQPPFEPTIGGYPVHGLIGNVGTTPTVAWLGPPSATGYEIRVVHVYDAGAEVESDSIARLVTTETEVHIPPDLLVEGEYYYLVISAVHMPDVDLAAAPFRTAAIRGKADVVTNMFTP